MSLGIQSRVPASEYYGSHGISISMLKELRYSPARYLYRLTHPKNSEPLKLGTAAHTAVLEPERFERDYIVWGETTASGRMRPRSGKDWESFATSAGSRTILTAAEYASAMAMQKSVRGSALAMKYLDSGEPEVTMRWKVGLGEMELDCRGRVDWLTTIDGEPWVVGLKTARDGRPFIFGSASAKLAYHLQWSWYHDGFESIKGVTPKMAEIVVESSAPHDVFVYLIPDDIIDQGRDEYERLLERLKQCQDSGHWPGPQETEEVLTLPSWAYEANDDLSDLGLEM